MRFAPYNFTTGCEKGVYEEKIRMAKELLKMKTMSLESIAQCTGLSVDEIKSL